MTRQPRILLQLFKSVRLILTVVLQQRRARLQCQLRILMSVLPTNTTVIPRRLAPTRSEVLPVHAKQASPEQVNHVPISTNARQMVTTVIPSLLVRTLSAVIHVRVNQDILVMGKLAPIITSVL